MRRAIQPVGPVQLNAAADRGQDVRLRTWRTPTSHKCGTKGRLFPRTAGRRDRKIVQ
jgi:hypothetical protein